MNYTQFNGSLEAWYFYAAELGTWNFRSSNYRKQHNISELFVILSMDDVRKEAGLWRFLQITSWSYDLNLALVN